MFDETRMTVNDLHLLNSLLRLQFPVGVARLVLQWRTRYVLVLPSSLVLLILLRLTTSLRLALTRIQAQASSQTTAMAPPIYSWPASELPDHTRVNVKDEFRKGFDGDLKACELLEMLQYRCEVENPGMRNSPTRCWPVARLFRR